MDTPARMVLTGASWERVMPKHHKLLLRIFVTVTLVVKIRVIRR